MRDRSEYMRKYKAARRDEINAKGRAYYAKNRESILAKQRLKYVPDTAEQRAVKRAWYWRRREAARSYQKKWQKENRDKCRTYERKYLSDERGRACVAQKNNTRRARMLSVPITATRKDILDLLKKAKACRYCGQKFSSKIRKTIDHIAPISLGGAHSIDNFTVCCKPCNSRKSDKLPAVFARQNGMLLI